MPCHIGRTLLLTPLVVAAVAMAQQTASPQPPLEHRSIDLSKETTLAGIPFTGALTVPDSCSSNGDTYLGIIVLDKTGTVVPSLPSLYRVSPHAEVKQVSRPAPDGYKNVHVSGFFAGSSDLVSVIEASGPIDQNGQPHPVDDFYLSVTDADGDHPRLVRLDLEFGPHKAAIFDSGSLLVLGQDRRSRDPVLAMLNSDGRLSKYFDIFPKSSKASAAPENEPGNTEKGARDFVKGMLAMNDAQFAPWGTDVLLVLPGIENSTVFRFRASGEVDRVPIRLPANQRVHGLLGSDGRDNWVVQTWSEESASKFAKAGIIENPETHLYEVNPGNGETLRRLDVKGANPGQVSCAVGGELSAVQVGDPEFTGSPLKLVYASSIR